MLNRVITAIKKKFNPDQIKILTNIAWLLGERGFRMVIGFFLLAWTARYLGTDEFGVLNYALAFSSLFGPLGQIASEQIIFRDLVTYPEEKEEILGTAFFIKTITGVIIFFIASSSILLLQANDPLACKMVIIVSSGALISGFNIIEGWFQSQVELKYTISARNIVFIITTAAKIILIELEAPVTYFAVLVLVESILNVLGFILVYKLTRQNIFAWRGNWQRAKKLMKISFPLIFSSLAIVLYMRIDQVMLGQLANPVEVGIYSAAVRLSEIWPFASTAIVKSIAPSIIMAKKESEELYYAKIQKLCNSQALLVYLVAIPMTFLSTPLISLVFGKEFAPAGPVLAIHIWSSMFLFLGYVKEIWITTEELTEFAFIFTMIGAIMNIILNAWLIPPYQSIGAAIATVVSYGCADYVACFLYPPARKFGLIMTQAMSLNLIKFRKT